MYEKDIVVFASGGGSGFEKLVEASRAGGLKANIVALIVSSPTCGAIKRAEALGIPWEYMPDCEAEDYQRIAEKYPADLYCLSGWLKLVRGLDTALHFNSCTVINIHPGLLPDCGGEHWYGHHVHERVIEYFKANIMKFSGLSMHFVTSEYDKGPVFFRHRIKILDTDDATSLGKRVNAAEHIFQPMITDEVVLGNISWDGINPLSLNFPSGYLLDTVEEYK